MQKAKSTTANRIDSSGFVRNVTAVAKTNKPVTASSTVSKNTAAALFLIFEADLSFKASSETENRPSAIKSNMKSIFITSFYAEQFPCVSVGNV